MKLGKNACSADLHMVFIREVGFVWRQLELAFFSASASVGALFCFLGMYVIVTFCGHSDFSELERCRPVLLSLFEEKTRDAL